MGRLMRCRELIKQALQRYGDLMNSHPAPGEKLTCVFDENAINTCCSNMAGRAASTSTTRNSTSASTTVESGSKKT